MGLNTEKKNYVIGRGDLFFAERKADGTLGGERPIGNTPEFSISVTTESVKHFSSARGMRVQDRDVPVQTDYASAFATDDVNAKNMAALLLGAASTATIAAQAAIAETFVDVEQGLTYQLGMSAANPAGVQHVTITTVMVGATPAVLNTDYSVDLALGRLTVIEGSLVIVDGSDVVVTYDRAASTQERVVSGSKVIEGALRFVAYNPVGEDRDIYLPDVKLSPAGDFNIKSDNDFQKMPFKVSINTPTVGAAIYDNGRAWTA